MYCTIYTMSAMREPAQLTLLPLLRREIEQTYFPQDLSNTAARGACHREWAQSFPLIVTAPSSKATISVEAVVNIQMRVTMREDKKAD